MPDDRTTITLSPKVNGQMRQYKRILLSYADFKHARMISAYILASQFYEQGHPEGYTLHEALNCSMILAYCRPFSGNKASTDTGIPNLPNRVLKVLNIDERSMHDSVMHDRNKVLAHSDDEVLQVEPVILRIPGCDDIVMPVKSWGLAPLIKEATLIFHSAVVKLEAAMMEERMSLEIELKPHFRIVQLGVDSPSELYRYQTNSCTSPSSSSPT